uniref:Satellite-encoded protein n=2 Tax=Arabis mosaic virus TaxID=12271 RepID=A0A4D6EB14_ARMV
MALTQPRKQPSFTHSPRVPTELLVPTEYARLFSKKQLERMLALACKHRARQAAQAVSKRTSRDRNGSKIMGQGPSAVAPRVSLGHKQQSDGGASLTPMKSKRAVRRARRRAAAKKAKAKTGTLPVQKVGPSRVQAVGSTGRASYLSSLVLGASNSKTKMEVVSSPPQTKRAPIVDKGGFTLTSITPAEARKRAGCSFHPITGSFRSGNVALNAYCTRSREGCGECKACVDKYCSLRFARSFDQIGTSCVLQVEAVNGDPAGEMDSPSATEPLGFWAPAEMQAPSGEGRSLKRCDVVTLARVTPVLRMLRRADPTLVDSKLLWESAFRTVFPQRKCAYPHGCFTSGSNSG